MANDDFVEDAEIDGLERRSWLGGLVRGALWGVVIAAGGIAVLSLSQPLPDHLPGVGAVKVVGAPERAASGGETAPATGADGSTVDDRGTGAERDQAAADAAEETETAAAEDQSGPEEPAEPADAEQEPDQTETASAPSDETAESSLTETEAPSSDPTDGGETVEAPTDEGVAARDEENTAEAPIAPDGIAETEPAAAVEPEPQTVGEAETADAGEQIEAPNEPASSDAGQSEAEEAANEGAEAVPETAEAVQPEQPDAAAQGETEAEPPDLQADGDQGTFEIASLPAPQEDADADQPADAAAAAAAEPLPEIKLAGKALDVNARSFDVPEDAPLMAVVLVGAASGAVQPEALALLTMPLTLTIAADSSAGRTVAEQARAAGHEILAELPMAGRDEPGAGLMAPGQPEADLLAKATKALSALDLAVGATAPSDAELLQDVGGMRTVMRPVARHGFAWVDPKAGTGSAARSVATAEGAAWIGSDRLVAADATEEQIYQNLESASLQARRKGTTIVFVTAGEPTLKALLRWGLERGGQEVWFAPISAVIARRDAE